MKISRGKKEPLIDESGEFHDSEMRRRGQLNDVCDLSLSEPPVAEKEGHSEDETQVEEPDLVTEESRDIVREPLRLPRSRLTSKRTPPSADQEEGMESKSKKDTRQRD